MGTQNSTPPADNYATFLTRLDAATANLNTRKRSVDKALKAVALLLEKYNVELRKWERRRALVNEELGRRPGESGTCAALGELHDTAVKMASMHRAQIQRIRDKLSLLQAQSHAIDNSLVELEGSRVKLNESRSLSRDRQNLNRVLHELARPGGAVAATPDPGLRSDLREAREAVILAEALIEVKGPS